jgi:hypothetical protein
MSAPTYTMSSSGPETVVFDPPTEADPFCPSRWPSANNQISDITSIMYATLYR